jgi:hypothetical protein
MSDLVGSGTITRVHKTHEHSALAVAAQASRGSAAVTVYGAVASSRALLGARPHHANALGSVPTSYLPTGGLVDSLDARVDDPVARCGIWRADDYPLPALIGEAVTDPKLHREDLGVAR